MRQVADYINEKKREAEALNLVMRIQERLQNLVSFNIYVPRSFLLQFTHFWCSLCPWPYLTDDSFEEVCYMR